MIAESSFAANAVLAFFHFACGATGFSFFRSRGSTLSESAAYALMVLIMIQSWLAQVLVLSGLPALYLLLLSLSAGFSVWRYPSHHRLFMRELRVLVQFLRTHRLAASGLILVLGYAGVVCFWPLDPFVSLASVAYPHIWNHPHPLLGIWQTMPDTVLPVLNQAVFLAPWQPSAAAALTNISAYAAIGFGTYALARRYAWPPMAATVTLLVISMPRVVYQSMTVPCELLPAAASLTAVVALYRLCEQLHARDIVMLGCAIAFSVHGGRLCYLMPVVLCALSLVVLGRRHGMAVWRQFGSVQCWREGAALVAGLAVFSQIIPVGANLAAGMPWVGAAVHEQVAFNTDAHWGLLGNLVRYLILSFDLPALVDHALDGVLGVRLLDGLKWGYDGMVHAVIGNRGAAAPFVWEWTPVPELAWFGPAGFFLVIPAVGAALLRGPRRLKVTAAAMSAYWLLIGLILAWQPGNVRLMTGFYVCTGFFIAFLLPAWRVGRKGLLVLQVLSLLLLVYVLIA